MSDSTDEAPSLRDLVADYLADQDPERLRRLRGAVLSSASFDPDLNLLAEVAPLLDEGRHGEVVEQVTAKMPGAALNPMAHTLLAAAHEEMGNEEAARRESQMARVSVSSVLATGDGTRERPWSVLRVADEYDVLRARQLTPHDQSAEAVDGRLLDRFDVDDGEPVWFVVDTQSPSA